MIAAKDVSIVIQGPVCGTDDDPQRYTRECIYSARKFFPEAEVIFSTWKGENTSGLGCTKIVLSESPRLEKCLYEDMTEHYVSTNHVLLSSQKGLEEATRRYVIKMRSDMAFRSGKCLSLVGKYDAYDKRTIQWKVFRQRVLTLPQLNPKRANRWFPYSICDWIQIGLSEDIIELYDVPLVDIDSIPRREGMKYIYSADYFGAEQYLFHSLLDRHGLPVKLYSRTDGEGDLYQKNSLGIAMNMVLLSARQMGVKSLKYPGRMYAIEPILSLGYYTFGEWKELYNEYGGGNLLHTTSAVEQVIYSLIFNFRKRSI